MGEIRQQRLKICKIAKFESDSSEASEDIVPFSCGNLQVCAPHHTNLCKISRLRGTTIFISF